MKKTEKTSTKSTKTVVKAVSKVKKEKKTGNAPVSHGVGRRKAAVARVWMRKGKGVLTVNGRDPKEYFGTEIERATASTPFAVCKEAASFDMDVNVAGGGTKAQADAIKLGISRALIEFNADLKPGLKEHGLLTVDSRVKERKKYGQKAARRKFQFVKR